MSLWSFWLWQANNPVYVSTSRVRAEAGLTGNSNITDTTIDVYIEQAHSIVQGMVSSVYEITNLTQANADFIDSHAEWYLARAEELIAAGYILLKEFGTNDFDETKKEGTKKVREGEALLTKLSDDEKPVNLLDINWNKFATVAKKRSGVMVAGGATTGENIFSIWMKL